MKKPSRRGRAAAGAAARARGTVPIGAALTMTEAADVGGCGIASMTAWLPRAGDAGLGAGAGAQAGQDRVGALDGVGEGCRVGVGEVSRDDPDRGGDLAGVANHGGDVVAGREHCRSSSRPMPPVAATMVSFMEMPPRRRPRSAAGPRKIWKP